MPNTNTKKSNKKRKNKAKIKKYKPKLSENFQQREKEINSLLKSTNLSIDKVAEDSEEMGIVFFCIDEHFKNSTTQHKEPKKCNISSSAEESEQSETPRTRTISSFIQVEDEDPILRVANTKIVFNQNLLFIPSTLPNPYITSSGTEDAVLRANPNLTRLVNRLYEEGHRNEIACSTLLRDQSCFFKDCDFYATICEREFHPVFCVIKIGSKNTPILPNRKLITLAINGFKFTEHPLQGDEHVLANKLEELLEVHFRREAKEILPHLKNRQIDIRKFVNEVFQEGNTASLIDLERNLNKLRQLRKEIHHEEAFSKDLVRNILDTWVKLKNLRRYKEFHMTSIKLKIKIKEIERDQDTSVWMKRFETELNEIYREELEAYYRFKRLHLTDFKRFPEKVKKPNIELLKKEVKETLRQCTRNPGEPKIEIIRSNLSDPCRPLDTVKSYFMKFFFDGQLVASTKCFRLEPDLSLAINECLGIYLDRRIPREVKIKLYEKKRLPSNPLKIANIIVPLPSTDKSLQDVFTITFSSHKIKNISGRINVKFHCDNEIYSKEVIQKIFPPPTSRIKIPENLTKKWRKKEKAEGDGESQLESQQYSEDEDAENSNQKDTCTFQETLLKFCSQDEIDDCTRLQLLSSTYKRDMTTKDIIFVPCLENECDKETNEKIIEIGNWMNQIDIHKHNGKKYIGNLYEVVKNHCDKLALVRGISDEIMLANNIVSLKSIFVSLASKFGPSRPLNLERQSQTVSTTHESVHKFNIIVNIVRATGIPVRSQVTQTLERTGSSTTSVFSSQSNPMELKEDLKVSIFDEFIENHLNDDRSMEIYQRYQSNWLGEYRFPISTILSHQRIEGVFELNSPKVLLGYKAPSLSETLAIENIPEIKERIHLWLYVSVEPSFKMPQMSTKNLECSELKEVRQHIQEWCVEAKGIQTNRFIDPFVCTMNGKRVCLTRLLEPVPLPIENSGNLLETSCKYVSLLNIPKHYDQCMQFCGMWLNNQTILDTGWASAKDLGILLANFILTIGIRCWVVLGISYPYGESAYVLYQEEVDFVFIDPSTGKKYTTRDSFCPMSKVFYIISQDNVFYNIQRENRVSMMVFDVKDSSCWLPMFDKKNPAPLGGIQKLNYAFRKSYNITELRKNIERKIMKKISAWRPMQTTIWNRAFQEMLYKILVDLEYESTFSSITTAVNHSERIIAEFGNYKLFGFTLNFSYTNLSTISDRIKSTGIHLNVDKKVEFSVAVHIHPYPFNVLSVWIFLVSAVPM